MSIHGHKLTRGSKSLIGEYLIAEGLITQTMLEAALAEQRVTQEKLGLILTRNGFVTRKALIQAILNTEPDRLQGESVFTIRVPPEVLQDLQTMVVAELPKEVYVSTLGDESQVAADLQPYYPEAELHFVAASHEQINQYLDELTRMQTDEGSMVEKLLRQALASNTSDVHIMPRYGSYSVFFRQLGVRNLVHEGSLEEFNTLSARIKDMSKMDLAERRIPQDGGYSMEYNGKVVDLRVVTVPTKQGEGIVIRLLDPDRVQPSLTGLGITRVAEWRKGVSRPDGLCLICGPTGSGKTTTLNASIKELNRFERAIYTLEDPVEYGIAYVGQVNVNNALGLDFARGVRTFMRADPDVIIVGEIRDAETARNAVKAAETGHLVIGTLHTGSIPGAVTRLRDLDIPAHELRYLLRTILVQRLVRIYCTHCQGKGCPACGGQGFAARTVVSECAYFSDESDVNRLLEGERFWPSLIEDAALKVDMGLTSESEVARTFGAEAETFFNARRGS